jgi:preprotein translocase subunit SecG
VTAAVVAGLFVVVFLALVYVSRRRNGSHRDDDRRLAGQLQRLARLERTAQADRRIRLRWTVKP